MGIHGLRRYLLNNNNNNDQSCYKIGREIKNINLKNKRIFVDGNGLMYYLYNSQYNLDILSNKEEIFDAVQIFMKPFIEANVRLIIIFDGFHNPNKKKQIIKSRKETYDKAIECRRLGNHISAKKNCGLPFFMEQHIVSALTTNTYTSWVTVKYSIGENDQQLAYEATHDNGFAIMAEDSDNFVLSSPGYIPFESIYYKDDEMNATLITVDDVLKYLDLNNYNQLVLSACLIGNDQTRHLSWIHDMHQVMTKSEHFSSENVILSTIQFVKQFDNFDDIIKRFSCDEETYQTLKNAINFYLINDIYDKDHALEENIKNMYESKLIDRTLAKLLSHRCLMCTLHVSDSYDFDGKLLKSLRTRIYEKLFVDENIVIDEYWNIPTTVEVIPSCQTVESWWSLIFDDDRHYIKPPNTKQLWIPAVVLYILKNSFQVSSKAIDVTLYMFLTILKTYCNDNVDDNQNISCEKRHAYEIVNDEELMTFQIISQSLVHIKWLIFAVENLNETVETWLDPLLFHQYYKQQQILINNETHELVQWFQMLMQDTNSIKRKPTNIASLSSSVVISRGLSIIPPNNLWKPIQKLRMKFDVSYKRFMPHINVVFPLQVNETNLLMSDLNDLLDDYNDIEINLTKVDVFKHSNYATICILATMKPESAWKRLQSRLKEQFNNKHIKSNLHLTIARPVAYENIKRVQKEIISQLPDLPVVFPLKSLNIIQLNKNEESFKCVFPETILYKPDGLCLMKPAINNEAVNDSESIQNSLNKLTKLSINPKFTKHLSYYFDTNENTWKMSTISKRLVIEKTELRIVSLNILMDKHFSDLMFSNVGYEKMLNILKETNADIIGLQEVTREFLSLLLQQPWVREHYNISDNNGSTLKEYGQIILCRFQFITHIGNISKNKMVVFAETNILHTDNEVSPVVLGVIHLTSSMHGGTLTRLNQLKMCYDYLSSINSIDKYTCGIFGDFNFGSQEQNIDEEFIPVSYVDVWPILNDDSGFTMDQNLNVLAQITNGQQEPKRLDRLLLNSNVYKPNVMKLFGTETFTYHDKMNNTNVILNISDHFGIQIDLNMVEYVDDNDILDIPESSQMRNNINMSFINEKYLQEMKASETAEGNQSRLLALELLSNAVSSILQLDDSEQFRIYPTGSFQLETHRPESDIDVVLACTMRRKQFFSIAKSKLLTFSTELKILQILDESMAMFPLISLLVNNCVIDIQYAEVPPILLNDPKINLLDRETISTLQRRRLNVISMLALDSLWCNTTIMFILPSNVHNRFRLLLKYIVLWAKKRQVYGNRFGFLGGYGFAILCCYVCKKYSNYSLSQLIYEFFRTYANWKWYKTPLSINNKIKYHMKPQEAYSVLSVCEPYRNVARNTTRTSRQIMIDEFKRAEELLNEQKYDDLLNEVNTFNEKAVIEVSASSLLLRDHISLTGYINSRTSQLILLLERQLPEIKARLYTKMYEQKSNNYSFNSLMYIGLQVKQDDKFERDSKQIYTKLKDICLQFRDILYRWDCKTDCMDICIKPKKSSNILSKIHDQTSLIDLCNQYHQNTVNIDDQKVDMNDVENNEVDNNSSNNSSSIINSKETVIVDKLTPVHKVLNRLLWDPSFDCREFTVVYNDRFLGLKEKSAASFKVDQSSDDFIPYHRIWQLKHGEHVIWDRKLKIDVLNQ